jgi:hypothetical protein
MEKVILRQGVTEHFHISPPINIPPMTHSHIYSVSGTRDRANRPITVNIPQLKHRLLLLVTVVTAVNRMTLIVTVIELGNDISLLSPHKFVDPTCCY